VTSYKRLVVGAPTSGATWAPAYITYGYNNRTLMLRIPGAGRVEDRTVDGSCNPYLAATAVLAAGLDGIERRLDPGAPTPMSLNMYELGERDRENLGIDLLPANLLDATRALEADDVLRKAFGNTGLEDYVDYYVRVKRREWQEAHEQVTQWEIDRYLQLF
jgi:glutamine synthetase